MELVRVRLVERIARTPSVESFRFLAQSKIDFIPGQFMQVLFDEENPANKELNKYLSFSSSPTREYIEFTKRLSNSAFSQRLQGLAAGDDFLIKAPLGSCVFRSDYKRIGFLIGGIGITPAISIIEYIFEKGVDTDVCLLYSNRTPEEIAFKRELEHWSQKAKNIRVSFTVTDCQPQDKTCLFGSIDKDLIRERMCDFGKRIIFIFGPPRMVEAMKGLSTELGVRSEDIKTEMFIGY